MNRSQRTIGNEVAYRYQGFAARATYDYENKYLFEANVGINGSENFSKAHRYGVFPSFSIGWFRQKKALWMEQRAGWII